VPVRGAQACGASAQLQHMALLRMELQYMELLRMELLRMELQYMELQHTELHSHRNAEPQKCGTADRFVLPAWVHGRDNGF
jgi:hypothetical protein